jgi:DNA-directed RNA polymerase subunit RPC12/RpoP
MLAVPRSDIHRTTCPQCQSRRVAHSRHPGFWGWPLLRWLPIQVYRCTDCWHRFLGVKRRRTSQVPSRRALGRASEEQLLKP